ncbi:MAG: hypothetical protein LBK23_08690 [Oscillospiraceae bacterium]|jgi:hypothetical protein|nr:hypothetical protein [Oscillospiraceae bacterium]
MAEVKIRTGNAEIEFDGLPMIRLTLALPELSGAKFSKTPPRAVGRVNAFYGHMSRAIEAHARRRMLPRAVGSFRTASGKSRPFEPYRVKMRCSAKISEDGRALDIERVFYVRRDPGDERERRFVEIWDLKSGLITRALSEKLNYLR